jgi:hypothetical protein
MKNTITTIVAIIMALSFTMQSCSKDDGGSTTTTPTPTNNDTTKNDTLKKPKPTVTWKTTADYKFKDGNETAGNNIYFGIIATSSSNEKITKVTILLSVNNGPSAILFDSTMKVTSFNKNWVELTFGNLTDSKNKYTAVVTQSNGESASISFTLTAIAPVRNTQITKNIVVGAQANTLGSFFNPKMGATGVMTIAVATDNQPSVHIIYYVGTNNKATFSAPSDMDITQIFSSMSGWRTRNPSLFKKTTLTTAQFDALDPNDASQIDTECTNGTFATKATQLKVNDVIAYRTFDGSHYALLKVVAIKNGTSSNSEITFDMANPEF